MVTFAGEREVASVTIVELRKNSQVGVSHLKPQTKATCTFSTCFEEMSISYVSQ